MQIFLLQQKTTQKTHPEKNLSTAHGPETNRCHGCEVMSRRSVLLTLLKNLSLKKQLSFCETLRFDNLEMMMMIQLGICLGGKHRMYYICKNMNIYIYVNLLKIWSMNFHRIRFVLLNSMSYNLLSNTCGLLANTGYDNNISHDVPHPQLPWDRKQWDEAFDPTSQGVPLRSHETQHEALLRFMVQESGEKTTWDVKFPCK